MADGEHDDDDFASGRRPAPQDRTWQHPSEVGAARRLAERRAGRRIWRIGTLSAITGALVVGGLWYLSDPGTDVSVVTQRAAAVPVELAAPVEVAAPTVSPADEWATEVALAVRPATAIVASADGTHALAGAVALRNDGYYVTSSRALGEATEFVLHTHAGLTLVAVVVGRDADTDLLVLETDGGVASATAASSPVVSGDTVAVVDPAGAAHRRVVTRTDASSIAIDGDTLVGLIGLAGHRRDLPAGSPVLDATGAVLGILSATESNAPATFVPIAVATAIAESIIHDGEARKVWLGVSAAAHEEGGVVVTAVSEPSPAFTAGVLIDDHIVGIGDDVIDSPAAMVAALRLHEPGSLVVVHVKRDGQTHALRAVLAEGEAG